MTERQCGRRHDVGRWGGFTLTGRDIEHDIGGMDAVTERFGTGRPTAGRPSVSTALRMSTICRLPWSVLASLRRIRSIAAGSTQSLKGAPLRKAPGAGEHRHIMPGVVDGIAAVKGSRVLGNDASILADHDAIGIGVNLDRSSDCAGCDRVLVVVEAHQAGLRRCRHRMEAVEAAGIGNEFGAFGFEHFPDRLIDQLRMAMSLGIGDAFVEQPGV